MHLTFLYCIHSTMSTLFKNIADIHFGSSYSSSEKGTVAYFQVNNLTEGGCIDEGHLVYIQESVNIDRDDYLQSGDILLPAKGSKFSSVIVTDNYNYSSVASSSLFVIRINADEILPEYLQWYLNLPRTQWELEKGATGTNISSLSIKYLRKLMIELPNLDVQKKIVSLKNLEEKESEILSQLLNARKRLVQAVTKNILRK